MKNLITCLIIAILFSCTQNNEIKNEETTQISKATIIGLDIRQCVCCGGYIIKIENEEYRVSPIDLPDNNLDFTNLPLDVIIEWELIVDVHENLAGQIDNCTDIIDILNIGLN